MQLTQREHPRRETFRRLVDGKASAGETRAIVRHLLSGCPSCADLAEEARRPAVPTSEGSYDAVFARLAKKLAAGAEGLLAQTAATHLGEERARAHELFTELLGLEAVEGLTQVQSTRRYASLALCELLLEKGQALLVEDPDGAHKAAQFAVAVAEQLDLDLYGAPVVQDMRAIAWACFANARRVKADLRSAEISLELAERLLEHGSGDPLARAELLTLEASLAGYCGRFDEAVHTLNRVASIYRRAGESHLLGRTLLKKGTVLGNAGQTESAIRFIRQAIDLIDPPREPRLLVCATHNLIWFLNENGHQGQAAACLDGARRLYAAAGDRRHLALLRWLEGKLAPTLGQAEEHLHQASEELAREGLSYEAALAAMDLAVLYAGERRGAEMRRQAEQMLPLFRSGDMYRETVIALTSFERSGADRDPAGLLRELGSYIRHSRQEKNPPALAQNLLRK
jgi:tetratricopeptide (TPR) repeat protein